MMNVCNRCTQHSGTNGTPECIALVHDANGCTALAPDLGACACPCRQNDEQLTNEEQTMTTTEYRRYTTTHYHLTINGTLSDPYLTETDAYADEGLEDNPADGPEECNEACVTDEHLTAYICRDSGNIPCSRYARQSYQLAPIAIALLALYQDAGAESDALDLLDAILSQLVNDSDEPETFILQNCGPREAADLLDYLDRDTIDACRTAYANNY